MLGLLGKKKTDEQIKKDRQKFLEEAFVKVSKLKKLINSPEWKEFVSIVDEYVGKCRRTKVVTALDIADDKTIYELKLMDHGVHIMKMLLGIPESYISKIERMKQEEEENGND